MRPPDDKLRLHATGQWFKRIGGKIRYFGTDYNEAMEKFLRERAWYQQGLEPPEQEGPRFLPELANRYHSAMTARVEQGNTQQRTLDEATETLHRLIASEGRRAVVESWEPKDYQRIKSWLYVPIKTKRKGGRSVNNRSHSTVDGDIRRIRAFLNWCYEARLISKPNYGGEFSESPKRIQRLTASKNKHVFESADLRAIIDACHENFRPIVLLGINGGMGARDAAQLRIDQIEGKWLHCPRNKTGVDRKIWLWPETREAIEAWLDKRIEPLNEAYRDLAFLTSHRVAWVRERTNSTSQAFTKARARAGVDVGTFYDLRRTFQTAGDETLDFPAVRYVMGHTPDGADMSSVYRQVNEKRIKRVCKCVRKWLYG